MPRIKSSVSVQSAQSAAGKIAFGILASRIVGFLRESIIASQLGLSIYADAFRAALRIPNLLQNLLGEGAISASFIPVYGALLEKGERAKARSLVAACFALLFLVSSAVVLVGVIFAETFVAILAPGFDDAQKQLTAALLRITFPATGILVISALALGVLNAHRRFSLPNLAPVYWNLAIIAAPFLFPGEIEQVTVSLAWGSFLGAILQFSVQLPLLLKLTGAESVSWKIIVAPLKQVVLRLGPTVMGRGVVQISSFIDQILASLVNVGALAALSSAQAIYLLPISLFAISVSTSELTEMSRIGSADLEDRNRILRSRAEQALRTLVALTLPAALYFIILGDDLVIAAFRSSRFTATDAERVWGVLAVLSIGILPTCLSRPLSSVLYALGETRIPFYFALIRASLSSLIAVGFVIFYPEYGLIGIAAAAVIAACCEFTLLQSYLRRRIGLALGSLGKVLFKVLLLSVIAFGATRLLLAWGRLEFAALELWQNRFLPLAISILFSGVAFSIGVWTLKVEELWNFVRPILRRLGIGAKISLFCLLIVSARVGAAEKAVTPTVGQQLTVRHVYIEIKEIFEDESGGWFYRTVNSLKSTTRVEVVERELFLKPGDLYDPFLVKESERNLRTLTYLRAAKITPQQDGEWVDLYVSVQDTWTIVPQFTFPSGSGRNTFEVGIAEADLLGTGRRVELLAGEDQQRRKIEAVYDERSFMGTTTQLRGGYFDRSDGYRGAGFIGTPFRSLTDPDSWSVKADTSDLIGKMYRNGTENFLYRAKRTFLSADYRKAHGEPKDQIWRYGFGVASSIEDFSQANDEDFRNVDVNPSDVSRDPELLAQDRSYTGPLGSIEYIEQKFISGSYLDRYTRQEDFNIGLRGALSVQAAAEALGSDSEAMILSTFVGDGADLSKESFVRGEMGFSGRLESSELENLLFRAEGRLYAPMGPLRVMNAGLGIHTLAAAFSLDSGSYLDRDRQFTLGADNGLRGYSAFEFAGSGRMFVNVEDRIHMVEDVLKFLNIGSVVFFDVGTAGNDDFFSMARNNLYSSVGAGLRFQVSRASGGGKVFRIDVGVPLRSANEETEAGKPQILISIGQAFEGQLRSEELGPGQANLSIGLPD